MRFVKAATQLAAAVPFLLPLACGFATSPASSQTKKFTHLVGQPYRIKGKVYVPRADPTYNRIGVASWYGPGFHGRRTANGETYDMNAFTAAHPTLPLSTVVRVTNLANDRSITVRINDRGPYAGGRIIDLSHASARTLGFHAQGVARVRVSVLGADTMQSRAGEGDGERSAATTSTRPRSRRAHRPARHSGRRGQGTPRGPRFVSSLKDRWRTTRA